MEPFMSANSTVTCLRSPSRAALEARSARRGVWECKSRALQIARWLHLGRERSRIHRRTSDRQDSRRGRRGKWHRAGHHSPRRTSGRPGSHAGKQDSASRTSQWVAPRLAPAGQGSQCWGDGRDGAPGERKPARPASLGYQDGIIAVQSPLGFEPVLRKLACCGLAGRSIAAILETGQIFALVARTNGWLWVERHAHRILEEPARSGCSSARPRVPPSKAPHRDSRIDGLAAPFTPSIGDSAAEARSQRLIAGLSIRASFGSPWQSVAGLQLDACAALSVRERR
jgi:hypothetical protein